MQSASPVVVVVALVLLCGSWSADSQTFKTVVTYLGTDFIMADGCPLPVCEEQNKLCNREVTELKQEYDNCLNGEDGKFLGCVTDVLPNETNITIPVYANFCSGICYERHNKTRLQRLEHCPHSGKRQDVDPNLQRLF